MPPRPLRLVIAKSERSARRGDTGCGADPGRYEQLPGGSCGQTEKIPVFHMEAGNRCFDERVPEEINRRIVDHISDINLPYSIISREYLLREGIAPDRIIKTGSPMFEVLHYYLAKIRRSDVLDRIGTQQGEYFVVSCHREENVDQLTRTRQFVGLLNWLAEEYGRPIIVSTHPRTKLRLQGVKRN